MNRNVTLIGVVAGGVLTAMALSMGSASADELPDGPTTTPGNYGLNHPNPFGLTPIAEPDITGMVGNPWYQRTLSGTQLFDFDSKNIAPFVQDFMTKYVTVDGEPLDLKDASYLFGGLNLPVIDTMEYYTSQQQIILPPAYFEDLNTNIEWGVINIHNWGNFFGPWGYVYIDLVGAGNVGPNNDAIGTWFTTPFGAFDVSWLENGSFFGSPYVESQLFDVSDFNPGAGWADTVTAPGDFAN